MSTQASTVLDYIRKAPYGVTFQQILSRFEDVDTKELSDVIANLTMEKTILVRVDHSGKDEYAYAPRGKVLYDRFMDLLFEISPVKRSLTFYAEKLCVTPKYLSSIIKEYSGKTACEMLRERTLNEMTYRLRYTNETIKEIAAELDFPNLSFFGKFFKSLTGMSPMKYRKLYAADGAAKLLDICENPQ